MVLRAFLGCHLTQSLGTSLPSNPSPELFQLRLSGALLSCLVGGGTQSTILKIDTGLKTTTSSLHYDAQPATDTGSH